MSVLGTMFALHRANELKSILCYFFVVVVVPFSFAANSSTSSTVLRLSVNGANDCPTVVGARRKSTASTFSDSTDSMYTISNQSASQMSVESSQADITLVKEFQPMTSDPPAVPDGVIDFDRENWDDPLQASHYAMDIFNYLKEREQVFKIESYMCQQPHLTPWMRTLLIDWMVEVQETFELNHETLYLAVKIVDIYLGKLVVHRDKLQLLGAAALFMACKYDVKFCIDFVSSTT